MALPSSGQLGGTPTNAQFQGYIEDLRDVVSNQIGGAGRTELTIASGAVTPAARDHGGVFTIDTEGNAASDTLDTITQTNTPDGAVIVLMAENASRAVTLNHAAGGSGQILLYDSTDFVFASLNAAICLQRRSTDWVELWRFVPPEDLTALTSIATDDLLEVWDESAGTRKKITPPNLVTAGLGASLVHLQTITTAGAQSNADLTLDLTNYDEFVIFVDNWSPNTAGSGFWLRSSADGVTYRTASYQWVRNNLTTASVNSPTGSSSDSKIEMANDVGSGRACGTITVRSLSGLGVRCEWDLSCVTNAGLFYRADGAGYSAAAADGYLRLTNSAGSITNGCVVRLYGVKKS